MALENEALLNSIDAGSQGLSLSLSLFTHKRMEEQRVSSPNHCHIKLLHRCPGREKEKQGKMEQKEG